MKCWIIQCKYWSSSKEIRENAIAQLYGTTKMYELERGTSIEMDRKVKPVLVTNIQLSTKAKQFAQYLGVEVIENNQLGKYPSVKCNVTKSRRRFIE